MAKKIFRVIAGPTASGKEAAAVALAERLGAEIVVVDSMKIYRGLDVGTAKPGAALRAKVPHHCVDFVPEDENFSVAQWVAAAEAAIARIVAAGKPVVLVGGTALYYKGLLEGLCAAPAADLELRARLTAEAAAQGLDALHARLQRLDPAAAAKIHPHDARRIVRALEVAAVTGEALSARQTQWAGFHPPMAHGAGQTAESANPGAPAPARPAPRWREDYDVRMVVLDWPRPELRGRIRERVDRMLAAGLLDEARGVYERRGAIARAPLQAVAYKEFFPYFDGAMDLPGAVESLKTRTCQLAKSQMTWFRKFPAARLVPTAEMSAADVAEAALALMG